MLRSSVLDHRMNDAAFGLTIDERWKSLRLVWLRAHCLLCLSTTVRSKIKVNYLLSILGVQSLSWEGESFGPMRLIPRVLLRSKANSIEGGTSEVQLNIIAEEYWDYLMCGICVIEDQ